MTEYTNETYIKPEKLRFEKFSKIIDNELGTIRTVPENYYVATVDTFGTIIFEGIEANTREINKDAVMFWVQQNRVVVGIPEVS